MSLVNGIFATVQLIDYLVKLGGDWLLFFSLAVPLRHILTHATLFAIPVVSLFACPLAYFLYQDYSFGPIQASSGPGSSWAYRASSFAHEQAPLHIRGSNDAGA